jgi:radical SAM superfamily enzyme YgiQ (UPF0313 family)
MKVLLIAANTERVNMPTMPVGLACVAAATRQAGHETSFLDLMHASEPGAAVAERMTAFEPDVVGISVRNIDDQTLSSPRFLLEKVRGVVTECRHSSPAPLVLGGPGFSILPDAVLAYLGADFGVRGEGERAFTALLDRLERGVDPGDIPGVHQPGRAALPPAFVADLDALPFPSEELWQGVDATTPELWVPVESRRGCPNDCSYCATFQIQGRTIRSRSPRSVAEYAARLARAGLRRLYFVDNSFNIPEPHALELCRCLGELAPPVAWRCILYPHLVAEPLVRAMAAAGCVEVALGFESGCPDVLRQLNKRFDPADVRRISALLGAHGIRRIGFLLLGAPGETRDSVEQSLSFAESLGLDLLRVTVGIRIYPGTPLHKLAVAEGRLAADDDLLQPRFYLAPGLEPWIHQRVTPGMFAPGPR